MHHLPAGEGSDPEADGEQDAQVDLAGQPADDEHRDHGADAAGGHDESGKACRVAEQVLQHGGKEGTRREQHHADQEDHEDPGDVVRVAQQAHVEERLAGRGEQRMHEEVAEADEEGQRLGRGLLGGKPVVLLATVQEQLQGADGDRKGRKAEHVEADATRPGALWM